MRFIRNTHSENGSEMWQFTQCVSIKSNLLKTTLFRWFRTMWTQFEYFGHGKSVEFPITNSMLWFFNIFRLFLNSFQMLRTIISFYMMFKALTTWNLSDRQMQCNSLLLLSVNEFIYFFLLTFSDSEWHRKNESNLFNSIWDN